MLAIVEGALSEWRLLSRGSVPVNFTVQDALQLRAWLFEYHLDTPAEKIIYSLPWIALHVSDNPECFMKTIRTYAGESSLKFSEIFRKKYLAYKYQCNKRTHKKRAERRELKRLALREMAH